jgi:hypothetical protein
MPQAFLVHFGPTPQLGTMSDPSVLFACSAKRLAGRNGTHVGEWMEARKPGWRLMGLSQQCENALFVQTGDVPFPESRGAEWHRRSSR